MSKEEFSIYWPGTDVVKSRNNAFTPDHDGPHINWAKDMASAGTSAKITADVERRRKQGRDPSTFRGISRKADELIARHGGQYTRARARSKMPELKRVTKAEQLRALLVDGPKTSRELGAALATAPKKIRPLLCHDLMIGTVVVLNDTSPVRFSLVVKP